MADDRMFLRNKITGKTIGLAKHLSRGWYNAQSEKMQQFFDDHRNEFFEDPCAYEIIFERDNERESEQLMEQYAPVKVIDNEVLEEMKKKAQRAREREQSKPLKLRSFHRLNESEEDDGKEA